MTAPVLYPTSAQFSGVAKEATASPGTPVAMTNPLLTDNFVWVDTPIWLPDKAYRGVMGNDSFNEIEGVYTCAVTAGGPVFADTIGFVLGNILGDVTTTATAAPFTHKISLLNPTSGAPTAQPTTHTLTAYNGVTPTVGARQVPYSCFSQVVFSFDAAAGLLTWTGSAMGWKSVPAGARPTASPSAVKPQASWIGVLGLGGTVIGAPVASIQTGKITITREIEPEPVANGIQNPLAIARNGLAATFDLTFIAQDESIYNYMIGNTQPQAQLLFSSGAGQQVQFDIQQASFQKASPDYGNKVVRWVTSGKCVFNSTNVGTSGGLAPIQATLVNSMPSGSYT